MPGHPGPAFGRRKCKLVPGIRVLETQPENVDGRDNGVPADKVGGVPRPGHDGG